MIGFCSHNTPTVIIYANGRFHTPIAVHRWLKAVSVTLLYAKQHRRPNGKWWPAGRTLALWIISYDIAEINAQIFIAAPIISLSSAKVAASRPYQPWSACRCRSHSKTENVHYDRAVDIVFFSQVKFHKRQFLSWICANCDRLTNDLI